MENIDDWKVVQVSHSKGKLVWELHNEERQAWFTLNKGLSLGEVRAEIIRQMEEADLQEEEESTLESYRESLVPPFNIRTNYFWKTRNMYVSRKDSGPYSSLKDAYQVLSRRRREGEEHWVEDSKGQYVDFYRLNREEK